MQSELAPLDQLTKAPYLQVLTYPRMSIRSGNSRIRQLRLLGVTDLVFEGHARVGRLGILGLGTVGIVVKARAGGEEFALKIRRTDANRPDMNEEVRITMLVNRIGIGPTIRAYSKDFILMDLLEVTELSDWLKGLRGQGRREAVREMVHSILNQCRKLDIMGVDHGQLSNLRKHAVVAGGRPWIIDFESSGTNRKPKNVTAAAQYLFIGSRMSIAMRRAIGIRDRTKVISVLSDYKRDMTDFNYSRLLEATRIIL